MNTSVAVPDPDAYAACAWTPAIEMLTEGGAEPGPGWTRIGSSNVTETCTADEPGPVDTLVASTDTIDGARMSCTPWACAASCSEAAADSAARHATTATPATPRIVQPNVAPPMPLYIAI